MELTFTEIAVQTPINLLLTLSLPRMLAHNGRNLLQQYPIFSFNFGEPGFLLQFTLLVINVDLVHILDGASPRPDLSQIAQVILH